MHKTCYMYWKQYNKMVNYMGKIKTQNAHNPRLVLPCGRIVDHLSGDVLEMFEHYYGGIPVDDFECLLCPYADKIILDFGFVINVCTVYKKEAIKKKVKL